MPVHILQPDGSYEPPIGISGGGDVSSVAGRTGAVVLTAEDVGAGQLPSGVLLPSGVIVPSSADISAILGTSASKAAAGNDSRLSNPRTPTAHKTSHATGGSDALAAGDLAPAVVAGTAVVTADSRLSDARTPTAHKTSHVTGGSDALAAGDLAPSVIAGTAVVTADSRLSDARTPTAHKTTHATGGSDALTAADVGATTAAAALAAAKAVSLDQFAAPAADVPMASHKITGLADPASAQDAATRAYVLARALSDFAGSVAADIPVNSHKITGLANGSGAQDAAAFGQIPAAASALSGLLKVVYLSADAGSITASTVLATQTGLNFAVAASEVWEIDFTIILSAANTAMDAKINFVCPSTPTAFFWGPIGTPNNNFGSWGPTSVGNTPIKLSDSGSVADSYATGNLIEGFAFRVVIRNGSNAGSVSFQLAQNTSDAGALILKAGSNAKGIRLA